MQSNHLILSIFILSGCSGKLQFNLCGARQVFSTHFPGNEWFPVFREASQEPHLLLEQLPSLASIRGAAKASALGATAWTEVLR